MSRRLRLQWLVLLRRHSAFHKKGYGRKARTEMDPYSLVCLFNTCSSVGLFDVPSLPMKKRRIGVPASGTMVVGRSSHPNFFVALLPPEKQAFVEAEHLKIEPMGGDPVSFRITNLSAHHMMSNQRRLAQNESDHIHPPSTIDFLSASAGESLLLRLLFSDSSLVDPQSVDALPEAGSSALETAPARASRSEQEERAAADEKEAEAYAERTGLEQLLHALAVDILADKPKDPLAYLACLTAKMDRERS